MMRAISLLKTKWFVTVVALLLNFFIYFYPDLLNSNEQCRWHEFEASNQTKSKYDMLNKLPAGLRERILLNFPRLQDTSELDFPSPYYRDGGIKDIHLLAFGDPQINGNWKLTSYIKRLDNYGNDYYLGHIYKIMNRRMHPSHVAVMGDMFSSQWILDSEYYNRTYRFVERLFNRPIKHKKTVLDTHARHENYNWQEWLEKEKALDPTKRYQSRVYDDVYDWYDLSQKYPSFHEPLFINITGNHDIGYSGDATWQHMARFHLLFGQNNYIINYNKGTPEEWRLIVLDSLTLEGPALQEEFRNYTWSFLSHLNETANRDFHGTTVLFTHIPFYKKEGLCVDGPEHRYYVNNTNEPYKNGKLRSQNQLLFDTTQKVLNAIFPENSKNGIVLTGHDHYGCDDWYNMINGTWTASKNITNDGERFPVREIVVKSMMGDFDGQTGVLTGHFDYKKSNWVFAFSYCSFVVQHWWWAAKVTFLIAVFLQSLDFIIRFQG